MKAHIPPPFDRSYRVTPDFCAGHYPGDREPSVRKRKLIRLMDAGILHIINLMEEHEIDFCGRLFDPYENELKTLAAARDITISIQRFPVTDMDIPSTELMIKILDNIDQSLELARPVYLHCWGGLGRTGTVAGCWLVRHGIVRGKKALQKIKELRKDTVNARHMSPQTAEQRAMVITWKKGR